jgi:hypothetical protein
MNYQYPPNSPGLLSKNGDYYNNLSPDLEAKLNEILKCVGDDQINALNTHSLNPSLTVLRYLRANDLDSEKAIDHMNRNILWRKQFKIEELKLITPESILQCGIDDLCAVFPHWQIGHDKTGRW